MINNILTALMMISLMMFSIVLRVYRGKQQRSPTLKDIALFRLGSPRSGWWLSCSFWICLVSLLALLCYDLLRV